MQLFLWPYIMRENKQIAEVFQKLVSIDSPSLQEREMADYLKQLFGEIGVELGEDQTQEVTGSNAGNLFARIEGTGEPLLLAVHMDTVEPSRGKKAVLHEDGRVTSDGTTDLGGKTAENYRKAVEKIGLKAEFEKTFGGSDNNVFAQHGIEGLVIATSMNQVHSCSEYTSIPEIRQVSEILVKLVSA